MALCNLLFRIEQIGSNELDIHQPGFGNAMLSPVRHRGRRNFKHFCNFGRAAECGNNFIRITHNAILGMPYFKCQGTPNKYFVRIA